MERLRRRYGAWWRPSFPFVLPTRLPPSGSGSRNRSTPFLGLFRAILCDPQQDALRRHAAEKACQEVERRTREARERLHARQQHAAQQAAALWRMAKPADRLHQYLQAKQVKPYILRQLSQGRLLVPLCCAGQLVNLQIVLPSGEKRYLSGGQVQGCYSPLGKITEGCRLYVCEGWATGATLHAYTGSPVVCAMSAGNLKPVAIALRERYGEALDLVIAGDDDRKRRAAQAAPRQSTRQCRNRPRGVSRVAGRGAKHPFRLQRSAPVAQSAQGDTAVSKAGDKKADLSLVGAENARAG